MKATPQDYVHFHGMLCRPSTAERCIDSFRGGRVLFAAQDVYDRLSTDARFATDASGIRARDTLLLEHDFCTDGSGDAPELTVAGYYFVVLLSLTGLSTLLGRTRLVKHGTESITVDETRTIRSEALNDVTLTVPPSVLSFVLDRSKSGAAKARSVPADDTSAPRTLQMVQRFEYEFGGIVSVMMVHLVTPATGQRHLVEVFQHRGVFGRAILAVYRLIKRATAPLSRLQKRHSKTE